MFIMSVVNKVKKELDYIGFEYDGDVNAIEIRDDVSLFKICDEENFYLVRYYEDNSDVLWKYKLLEKYGIETGRVNVESSKIIALLDLQYSEEYRVGNKEELNNEKVVKCLARWYKKLHLVDVEKRNFRFNFDRNCLIRIMNKLRLQDDETLVYIYNNFDNIKLKYERINKSFVIGKFSLDSLGVLNNCEKIIISDLQGLSVGNRYSDIRLFIDCLNLDMRDVFFSEYGEVNEDEIIIDEVMSVIENLYEACKESSFPVWANQSLVKVHNKDLLKSVKRLVEWC